MRQQHKDRSDRIDRIVPLMFSLILVGLVVGLFGIAALEFKAVIDSLHLEDLTRQGGQYLAARP